MSAALNLSPPNQGAWPKSSSAFCSNDAILGVAKFSNARLSIGRMMGLMKNGERLDIMLNTVLINNSGVIEP